MDVSLNIPATVAGIEVKGVNTSGIDPSLLPEGFNKIAGEKYTSVNLPGTIESIAPGEFADCPNVSKVKHEGNHDEKIFKEAGLPSFCEITWGDGTITDAKGSSPKVVDWIKAVSKRDEINPKVYDPSKIHGSVVNGRDTDKVEFKVYGRVYTPEEFKGFTGTCDISDSSNPGTVTLSWTVQDMEYEGPGLKSYVFSIWADGGIVADSHMIEELESDRPPRPGQKVMRCLGTFASIKSLDNFHRPAYMKVPLSEISGIHFMGNEVKDSKKELQFSIYNTGITCPRLNISRASKIEFLYSNKGFSSVFITGAFEDIKYTELDLSKIDNGGKPFSGLPDNLNKLTLPKMYFDDLDDIDILAGQIKLTDVNTDSYCTKEDIDISNKNMLTHITQNCWQLTSVDFHNLIAHGSNCKPTQVFFGASKLESIDISGLTINSIQNPGTNNTFHGCSALKTLKCNQVTFNSLKPELEAADATGGTWTWSNGVATKATNDEPGSGGEVVPGPDQGEIL